MHRWAGKPRKTALLRGEAALGTAELRGDPDGGNEVSPVKISGCPDSNWGPLRPERSALPGCATPRERDRLATLSSRFRVTTPAATVVRIANEEAAVNSVNLIGNLATDVELKDVGPDKKVATFLLAVDRPGRDAGADFVKRLGVGPPGRGVRRVPREGRARRRRRPAAQPLVGGRRRQPAQRDRDRREPDRVPRLAEPRGGALRSGRVVGCAGDGPPRRIIAFADDLLDVASFPEYGRPGLQVVGADDVSKIACGVSSSRELFQRAGEAARSSCSSITASSGATSRCSSTGG